MNAPTFTGAVGPQRRFKWPTWVRTYLLDRQVKVACMRCVESTHQLIAIHDRPIEWVMTLLERAVLPHVNCDSFRGPM